MPFFRELEATAALEAVFDGVCLLLLAERVEAKSGLHLPKPSVNVAMVIRSLYAVLPEKKMTVPYCMLGLTLLIASSSSNLYLVEDLP